MTLRAWQETIPAAVFVLLHVVSPINLNWKGASCPLWRRGQQEQHHPHPSAEREGIEQRQVASMSSGNSLEDRKEMDVRRLHQAGRNWKEVYQQGHITGIHHSRNTILLLEHIDGKRTQRGWTTKLLLGNDAAKCRAAVLGVIFSNLIQQEYHGYRLAILEHLPPLYLSVQIATGQLAFSFCVHDDGLNIIATWF